MDHILLPSSLSSLGASKQYLHHVLNALGLLLSNALGSYCQATIGSIHSPWLPHGAYSHPAAWIFD